LDANVKKNYITRTDDGKIRYNAANLGGSTGDIYTRVSGEYSGLGLELLEPLRPLITSNIMHRVLSCIKEDRNAIAMELLNLSTLDQLAYTIRKRFSLRM
jgi:hypothetical protein